MADACRWAAFRRLREQGHDGRTKVNVIRGGACRTGLRGPRRHRPVPRGGYPSRNFNGWNAGGCRQWRDRVSSRQDFTSEIRLKPSSGDGFDILQVFTSGLPRRPRTWHVAKEEIAAEVGPRSPPQEVAGYQPDAFSQGLSDRRRYKAWFGGLDGDARSGAEFWAGQRSLRPPPVCEGSAGKAPAWLDGCLAAKRLLTPGDVRRHGEPDYRKGWNSF